MKLYEHPRAPSPRRVRIFLAEKGVEVERVQVDLPSAEHLRAPFLDLNPAGAVPVLVLDDGSAIAEGLAICRYIEARSPEPSLFGRTPAEVGTIEMWIQRIERDGFQAVGAALRNAHPSFANRALPGPTPYPQIPALAERSRQIVGRLADWLDRELAARDYVGGGAFSMADISLLVTVDFAARFDLPLLDERPHLAHWHDRVTRRPSATA